MTKEDFETILGIKQIKGDDVGLNFQLIKSDYLFFEFDYDTEDERLLVERYGQKEMVGRKTGNYDCYTIFHGIIKTPEEFKVLLKQLEIFDENS